MPSKPESFKPEQVEAAMRAADGNLSETARKLKCTRTTVQNYIDRYPALKKVQAEISEIDLDFAERKLKEHIRKGSERMLQFMLSTKGRRRGYTETPAPSESGGIVQRVVYEVHKIDKGA
jgi:hypothetical protein